MQDVMDALACRAAGVLVPDISFNEMETGPGIFPHTLAHQVQIGTVSGGKVVQPDDVLS